LLDSLLQETNNFIVIEATKGERLTKQKRKRILAP